MAQIIYGRLNMNKIKNIQYSVLFLAFKCEIENQTVDTAKVFAKSKGFIKPDIKISCSAELDMK